MTPYYEHKGVTIYHGDCREILPSLPKVDCIITDPPYGINHPCDFKKRGRGALAECTDYPDVHEDSVAFDPSFLLAMDVPTCLFGANYYADKLPSVSGWIVWDKERPHEIDQATAELAWTNFVKGVRVFRYLWHGCMRKGNEELVHPTQKPVELFKWILGLKWTPKEGAVLDPYCGSGPVLIAAKQLGRRAIGIEIEERYCEIASKRLSQEVINFEY